MGIINRLPIILERATKLAERKKSSPAVPFVRREIIRGTAKAAEGNAEEPARNMLALGDNIDFIAWLLAERGMAGTVQLVYLDPPFFSKADYGAEIKLSVKDGIKVPAMKQPAYKDTWENGMEEYLTALAARLILIRELLSDEGCVWVHLDHHATHYVRVLLDEIFGEKNFVNEVIWTYKSGGATKRSFAKKHDNLLFYAKSPKYYFKAQQEVSYNRGYKPYRFKGVKEFRDETGWYTMVNKKDVWTIDMVGRTSAERTGYATQKPESLMRTILESCTREGDIVCDFYCGSGTMPAAAETMGRRWIACDVGRLAAINTHKRLVTLGAAYDFLETKKEAESKKEQGVLRADVTLEDLPLADRKCLRIRLTGYEPASLRNIPVEEKYLPTIRSVIKKDSLALIDFWSADWKSVGDASPADGTAPEGYAPRVWFCREGKHLELSYETLADRIETVTIKGVDIFGNGSTITIVCTQNK